MTDPQAPAPSDDDIEIEGRLRALAATLRGAAMGNLALSTTACIEAADAIDYLHNVDNPNDRPQAPSYEVQRWVMPALGCLRVDDREFVRATDYDALAARVAALEDEIAELKADVERWKARMRYISATHDHDDKCSCAELIIPSAETHSL